ncbi:MAG: endolytic transglycosylase MltG [Bacteriovoracaceae bacterium]|nr:endolytic transglycosylase MltG [Bacteriovoracaceae bacterium]
MKTKIIFFLFIAPLIGLSLVAAHIYFFHIQWAYEGPQKEFVIRPGETFAQINYRLAKEQLISNPRVFHHFTRWKNQINKINQGVFIIEKGMKMEEVLVTLTGPGKMPMVVLPEGKNLYEFAKILDDENITKAEDFVTECFNPETLAEFSIYASSAEGFLFPNSYRFAPHSDAKLIVRTLIKSFLEQTKKFDWQQQSNLNKEQLITLASIVEKETGAAWERKKIAGVFLNRLKKGMMLQSDPTTIYGIWKRFNGNLKKTDLQETTEYNTYKIKGLPKGPIANPGMESINAVLNPEQHNFLFFVSKNNGTHVFSATLEEHNRAVSFYQKNAGQREGKSWRQLKQKN